jgi:hypothetical protein
MFIPFVTAIRSFGFTSRILCTSSSSPPAKTTLCSRKTAKIFPLGPYCVPIRHTLTFVNYRYPKGNSGFKTPTPQLLPTANLDFCLSSESVPDTDLQVRHPFGSFCAAKVILFFNSTLKGSGFYRNFFR